MKCNDWLSFMRFKYSAAPFTKVRVNSLMVCSSLLSTEKPYIVKHPEDKVRHEGGRVLLCCKATGSPAPDKYYWWDEYHCCYIINNIITKQLEVFSPTYYYLSIFKVSQWDSAGQEVVQVWRGPCTAGPEARAVRTVLLQNQQLCRQHQVLSSHPHCDRYV